MSTEALTDFGSPVPEKSRILDALLASLLFLSVCWAVFVMDEYLGFTFRRHGMIPREWEGLRGILTMHFIHGNWKHLINNSMAFAVLNSFFFFFYRSIAGKVAWPLVLVSGALLWVIGRPSNHIGASMLVYGLFGFLFFSGLFRRNVILRRVSLFVVFYYGSMVWYIFPIDFGISWEGHLCGLVTGAGLAWIYRRKGPRDTVYRFETEPEPDESDPYWMPGYRRSPPENPFPGQSDRNTNWT